jgi:hypothetical protein
MYMVEHCYSYGWDDADWHVNDEPARFATQAEAEAAIRDFVRNARGYKLRDYRVVEVAR